jgi:uncharacterized repeat protein (TIGR01451 family)
VHVVGRGGKVTISTRQRWKQAAGALVLTVFVAAGMATPVVAVPVDVGTADLSVVNRVAPGPYAPPTMVTFELTVNNAGPSTSGPLTVTDTLPGGMTYVAAGSDPRCTSIDGTSIVCGLATLAAGAFDTVTVSAAVAAVTESSGFTNTASVSSSTPDPVEDNNTAAATIEVVAALPTPAVNPPPTVLPKTGGLRVVVLGTSWMLIGAGVLLRAAARRLARGSKESP